MAVSIRDAVAGDAASVARIYNHYVEHSHATFDDEPVTVDDREAWIAGFDPRGPHRLLVAVVDDGVVGFAGSAPYRDHHAFDRTVVLTVYLDPDRVGAGVGSALYDALIGHLGTQPVDVAISGIALPNDASIALHRRYGFADVGVFHGYAVKDGERRSSLWMERQFAAPA